MIDEELFPSNKLFRIIYDETMHKFRILAKYEEDLEKIIEIFSDVNNSAYFVKQHGYNANFKLYVINSFGYFELGLLYEVLKNIKLIYGTIDCIAISSDVSTVIKNQLQPLRTFIKSIDDPEKFEPENISNGKFQFREYQRNIIKNLLFIGMGRGLFECPTGSGKSFIIANFIYTLMKNVDSLNRYMIFVPNRQLVDQFYKDLLEYGFFENQLTRFTSGVKNKNNEFNQIIITNRQFVFRNMTKIPKIDVLICDEVHSVAPESSTAAFIENLNTKIKIGCSGTLPKNKYQRLKLIGMFGKIVHIEDILTLQTKGYLSKLNIVSLQIFDKLVDNDKNLLFSLNTSKRYSEDQTDIKFDDAWHDELEYHSNNFERLYSNALEYISGCTGNVLILFDRIPLGKNLSKLSASRFNSKKIWYIDGSTKIKDRENVRELLEKTDNNILFAQSVTFSTGINIKNLPNIAFFFLGKGHTKIIQSIGRTLRLHQNKKISTLIDISFNYKYSQKHYKERLEIYKKDYNKCSPDKIVNLNI